MKYIVMECHPSFAVLLDEDGRFIKAANLNYEVGQTVSEIIEMRSATPDRSALRKSIVRVASAAAALAACIILVFTFALNKPATYASVYLSINPEVRIDVDKRNNVVAVEGVNEDGKVLIDGYSCKGKQLDPVVDELIDRAIEHGYLYDGGKITFNFDSEHIDWVTTTEHELNDHVNEYLSDRMSVTIVIESAYTQEVTIPITPSQNESYADSDYGDSDYGSSDSGYFDSGYTDYKADTKYSDSEYDDDSDYGTDTSDYEEDDSDYEEDDSAYGSSDYD